MDYLKSTALVFAAQDLGVTRARMSFPCSVGAVKLCCMNLYESLFIMNPSISVTLLRAIYNHGLNKCTTEEFTENPQPQTMDG